MPRTRIKICGITRVEDAIRAQDLGADALGLNFYAKSPRFIDIETATQIAAKVGAITQLVGLFVNPEQRFVQDVLEAVPLNLLQFHGDEDDEFCNGFQLPWIKALRFKNPESLAEKLESFPHAKGLLLDSFVEGTQGGTGQTFDWAKIPELDRPYVLAGGLDASNVAAAIGLCRPYAVDISSGIESSPGVKDAAKMRAFMEAVGHADSSAGEIS